MNQQFNYYFGYAKAPGNEGWYWAVWDCLWVKETIPPLLSGMEPTKLKAQAKVGQLVGSPYLRLTGLHRGLEVFIAHHPQINAYAKAYFENRMWPAFQNSFESQRFAYVQNCESPVWSIAQLEDRSWGACVWPSVIDALVSRQPILIETGRCEQDVLRAALQGVKQRSGQGLASHFAAQFFAVDQALDTDAEAGLIFSEKDFLYANQAPAYLHIQQQWTAHLIVKQTESMIWVLQRPFPFIVSRTEAYQEKIGDVFKVDRLKLTQQGYSYNRAFGGYFRRSVFAPVKPAEKPRSEQTDALVRSVERALQFLCLDNTVSDTQLKKRYRELVFQYHPDHGGSQESFSYLKQSVDLIDQYLKNK